MNATSIDWIIAGIFLFFLTVGGIGCKYFIHGVADFVVAGRHLRKYLGLSTGTAEGIGIMTLVLMSEIGFTSGFSYIGISIVCLLVVPVVYGLKGFVINRYREAGVVTVPEYAQRRYSKGVRVVTAAALAFSGILNLAIFPIMASQFLTHFLNAPPNITCMGLTVPFIPVLMAFLIGLALVFAYCGGMVSVILTDFIQSIIIAFMVFFITILVIKNVGFDVIHKTTKLNFGEGGYNPFISETFGTMFIVVIIIQQVIGFPSFAPSMQKLASTDTAKTARQMTVLGFLFNQGRALMILIWGIAALAVMGNQAPEGMEAGMYHKVAGAIYLGKLIPAGLFGMALAGMLAAFISTVDTYLLCWSTVITNDIICPLWPKKISTRAHLWLLKIFVALIALFLYVFGTLYQPAESIWVYITMTGVMMLGSGIILIGGLYWSRGSTAGAYAAVIFCCLLPAIELILKRIFSGELPVSTQHFALGAIVSGILFYVVFSLLFPDKPNEIKGNKDA